MHKQSVNTQNLIKDNRNRTQNYCLKKLKKESMMAILVTSTIIIPREPIHL